MRRAKLTWIALACGILAATVESVFIGAIAPVIAQEDLEPFENKPSLTVTETESVHSDVLEVEEEIDHKEVYLELARRKAELLTPDELTRETLVLENELIELQATLKLRTAELQLQKLIDEFPKSAAAEQAKQMLRAGLRPVPTFESAPRAVPLPESLPDNVFGPFPDDSALGSPPEFLDDRVPDRKPASPRLKPAIRPLGPAVRPEWPRVGS